MASRSPRPPRSVNPVRRLRRDAHAATSIEYGLILALVALTMVGGLSGIADSLKLLFTDISTQLVNAR